MRAVGRHLALFALCSLVGSVVTAQRDDLVPNKFHPPAVGEIAPQIGSVRWLQLAPQDGGAAPEVGSLRGKVVVVQTYGHYCDP